MHKNYITSNIKRDTRGCSIQLSYVEKVCLKFYDYLCQWFCNDVCICIDVVYSIDKIRRS